MAEVVERLQAEMVEMKQKMAELESNPGRRQRGTVGEASPCRCRGETPTGIAAADRIGEIFFVGCSPRAMEPPVPLDDRAERRNVFATLTSEQWSHRHCGVQRRSALHFFASIQYNGSVWASP